MDEAGLLAQVHHLVASTNPPAVAAGGATAALLQATALLPYAGFAVTAKHSVNLLVLLQVCCNYMPLLPRLCAELLWCCTASSQASDSCRGSIHLLPSFCMRAIGLSAQAHLMRTALARTKPLLIQIDPSQAVCVLLLHWCG